MRTAIFLIVISLACTNSHAGKHKQRSCAYKSIDTRQQQHAALKTVRFDKKISAVPTARFERRHPIKHASTALSGKQRALLAGLTLMVLVPSVIAAIPDRSSMIYEVPYKAGDEVPRYGSRHILPDNSTLSCNEGENLTVTCCVHPNSTVYKNALAACASLPNSTCQPVSYCISYNAVDGVLGDQAVYKPINLTETYRGIEKECNTTHHIADEMVALQNAKRYHMLIPTDFGALDTYTFDEGPGFCVQQFESSLPNGTKAACVAVGEIVNRAEDLQTYVGTIKELASRLNIPKKRVPFVEIFNDAHCDEYIQRFGSPVMTHMITTDSISETLLDVYASVVKRFSDKVQTAYLGHELFHTVQPISSGERQPVSKVGNNIELEADQVANAATNSGCMAVLLKESGDIPLSSLQLITRENAAEMLKSQFPDNLQQTHPLVSSRISFNLVDWVHHKRAITYLLEYVYSKAGKFITF